MKRYRIVFAFLMVFIFFGGANALADNDPCNISNIGNFLNNECGHYFNGFMELNGSYTFSGIYAYTAIAYEAGHIDITKESPFGPATFTKFDRSNWGEPDYVDFETETLYIRDLTYTDDDELDPSNTARFSLYKLTAASEPLDFLEGDPALVLPENSICVGYNDHNGDDDYDDLIFCLFPAQDDDVANEASQVGSIAQCTVSFDGIPGDSDAFNTIDPERFVFVNCEDQLGNVLNPIYNVPPNVKIKVNDDGTIAYKPGSDVVRIDPPYSQTIQVDLTERFAPEDLINSGPLTCTCTVFNEITDPDPETDPVVIRTYRATSDEFTVDPFVRVEIDIKPGGDVNPINLKKNKKVPVAILTTPDFDATEVDSATVNFAGAPVIKKNNGKLQFALKDVDFDGDIDWMGHFLVNKLHLGPGATVAELEGKTTDGIDISGSDSVRIID